MASIRLATILETHGTGLRSQDADYLASADQRGCSLGGYEDRARNLVRGRLAFVVRRGSRVRGSERVGSTGLKTADIAVADPHAWTVHICPERPHVVADERDLGRS